MPARMISRNHAISDSDLIQYAHYLCGYLTRDAVQFQPFGVSNQDISDLYSLADELVDYPTDEEFVADIGIAAEDKNAKAEELFNSIKNIAVRAENKWGLNSYQYNKFGIAGLYRMNDRDLYFCAKRVHYVASGFLADMANVGLNQTILDEFKNLIDEFESKMFGMIDATANRDKSTEERIELSNKLYSYVVKYTNFGKLIWEYTSEARYNDYIIYSTPSAGTLTPPENLNYDASTRKVNWSSVLNSTSYLLQSSIDSNTFKKIYSGSDNFFVLGSSNFTKIYLRCCARNSNGYGPFSQILEIEK